jgi:hypothetical protein
MQNPLPASMARFGFSANHSGFDACLSYRDSFFRHGLLGERLTDGTPFCNLVTVGDDGVLTHQFDWAANTQFRLRLALEVVLQMLEAPSPQRAPLAHIVTRAYRDAPLLGTLPDGRAFSKSACALASAFERDFLVDSDPHSLCVIPEVIKDALMRYMRRRYPGTPTSQFTAHG